MIWRAAVRRSAAFMVLFMLSVASVNADSSRGGRRVVSEDLSPAEIREKCGEPDSKTTETVEVRGPDARPGNVIKLGTSTIERWTYRRGMQAAQMVVTIVDGTVKSVLQAEPQ